MTQEALGYAFNPAGLNNQKLALLGLVLTAVGTGPRRIMLPAFYNHDLQDNSRFPVPFGRLFDAQELAMFAARQDVEIAWTQIPSAGQGFEYFLATVDIIRPLVAAGRFGPAHIGCDFFRGLVPHLRQSTLLRRLSAAIFRERGIRVVAQLRIETDWMTYAADKLSREVGPIEDYAPGFEQIITKIRNTLTDWEAGIFVVCDEAALPLPKEDIRTIVRRELGVDLVWKSDFLSATELQDLMAIERSILDFELASRAPFFVGLTRSTFSDLVTLETFSRTRRPVENHYIYNLLGPMLARRTDNGLHAAAAAAIAPCEFIDIESDDDAEPTANQPSASRALPGSSPK